MCVIAPKLSSVMGACRHWQRLLQTTIELPKAIVMAGERARVWGSRGGRRSASDGRDCAAPVLARDPLEMVALEPWTLPLRGIERQFHGWGDPIVDL